MSASVWRSVSRPLGYGIFSPLMMGFFAIPLITFYPLFIVWFGIGPASKIAFAVMTGSVPIALNTMDGVRMIDQGFVQLTRSIGASTAQSYLRIYLPLALPAILSGLRIGTSLVVIGVIVCEMLASVDGIGFWISYTVRCSRPDMSISASRSQCRWSWHVNFDSDKSSAALRCASRGGAAGRWKDDLVNEFVGKHAAVTGAASGIGRATAMELAAFGAVLTILDRDKDGLEQTAAMAKERARRSSRISSMSRICRGQ